MQEHSETIKLFHCTPVSRLAGIQSEGLLPQCSESSLKAVFLSDCQFLAEGYAGQRPGEEHVVLAVELTALDVEQLGPDNYELQDWLDEHPGGEADHPGLTRWDDATWAQSLQLCNQVAYWGRVPPAALSVHKTLPAKS